MFLNIKFLLETIMRIIKKYFSNVHTTLQYYMPLCAVKYLHFNVLPRVKRQQI